MIRQAKSIRAETAFRARVAELGGEVLEPEWLGNAKRHRVRCAAGHEGTSRPSDVMRGTKLCRICSRRDPRTAEAAFRARVAELGGEVLEPEWGGAVKPHRVRCAVGHENEVLPCKVQQGRGICPSCAGRDPRAAWDAFRARVAELGGTVLEPAWLGTMTPHRARCPLGHEGALRPNDIRQGRGICRVCVGRDPRAAEQAFSDRLTELGATLLETEWLGVHTPHRVLCAAGHECSPRPNGVRRGRGICGICAGRDSRAAWEAFRTRIAEAGGEVLEPDWLGNHVPHRIRCVVGHESTPLPASVQQGRFPCRICGGKAWDVFYVVADDVNDVIKFGITSGDPRPRLAVHARDGFDRVVRLLEGLPGDTAPVLERTILAALRDAREEPVRGREYFPAHTLALVLDLVDNHPTTRYQEAA